MIRMIREDSLGVFVDAANRFFSEVLSTDIDILTPYLVENSLPEAYDYTGVISITGAFKGVVYFTAPTVFLRHLLAILQESDHEDNLKDLVGEIANTLSGNARVKYGSNFMVSTPTVIAGKPTPEFFPPSARSFFIPLRWKSYKAAIVICLTAT